MATRNIDPDTGEFLLGYQDEQAPALSGGGPVVGEIIQGDLVSFADLDEAETAFYDCMDRGESLVIQQMKILDAIREQRLFESRTRPKTGKPYGSMEEYLPDLIKTTAAFSTTAPRTLKQKLTCWRIYVQQMEKDPQWLLDMGSHAEVLLPVAARSHTTLALSPADEPLDVGGTRLGRENFERLVEEIWSKVETAQQNPGVDEVAWKVSQTRERVKEILGTSDEKARLSYQASFKGTSRITLEDLTFWVGDGPDARHYKIGDAIPLADFQKIAGSSEVTGLGEDWRQ
jgi:hypothetical protein